jgi:hypothetical protein
MQVYPIETKIRALQTESLRQNFKNEGIVYGAHGQIHQMPSKPCNHQAKNYLTSQQKSVDIIT